MAWKMQPNAIDKSFIIMGVRSIKHNTIKLCVSMFSDLHADLHKFQSTDRIQPDISFRQGLNKVFAIFTVKINGIHK